MVSILGLNLDRLPPRACGFVPWCRGPAGAQWATALVLAALELYLPSSWDGWGWDPTAYHDAAIDIATLW